MQMADGLRHACAAAMVLCALAPQAAAQVDRAIAAVPEHFAAGRWEQAALPLIAEIGRLQRGLVRDADDALPGANAIVSTYAALGRFDDARRAAPATGRLGMPRTLVAIAILAVQQGAIDAARPAL